MKATAQQGNCKYVDVSYLENSYAHLPSSNNPRSTVFSILIIYSSIDRVSYFLLALCYAVPFVADLELHI